MNRMGLLGFLARLVRPFRQSMTLIDLKGCAETANGIEKYGSKYAYYQALFLDLTLRSPRMNVALTGISVPGEAYQIRGDAGTYMGKRLSQ